MSFLLAENIKRIENLTITSVNRQSQSSLFTTRVSALIRGASSCLQLSAAQHTHTHTLHTLFKSSHILSISHSKVLHFLSGFQTMLISNQDNKTKQNVYVLINNNNNKSKFDQTLKKKPNQAAFSLKHVLFFCFFPCFLVSLLSRISISQQTFMTKLEKSKLLFFSFDGIIF